MALKGYWNRFIRVNLTNNNCSVESFNEDLLKSYLGGSGLGAKLLLDEVAFGVDPLGPDNKIFFLTGPLCGTTIPTSARHAAVTKSPLTGIFAESDIGGFWGFELKKAGYDGIIIEGQADKPVLVLIDDANIAIRDASSLWGKDTFATDELVKRQISPDCQVMCIGGAGEKLVKYAAVLTDGRDSRALGRSGIGAVMGAKKLKAVVVRGTRQVEVYDKIRLTGAIKDGIKGIKDTIINMNKFGTASGVVPHESYGNFPLKNWSQGRWPEGAERISGQRMAETILTNNYSCKTCIIGCGRQVKITAGPYKGVHGAGPEYETIGTLGGMCLIDNLEAIAYGSELCNRYGMDTITTGCVIAFTMELFENGILTKEETGGIEARFGNSQAMIDLIKLIGERKGIGQLLGEGVREAALKIGGLAKDYAFHVKGLEIPAHDPRAFNGLALSYATSNRGACHLAGFTQSFERVFCVPELGYDKPHDRHQIEGKALFVIKMQNLSGVFDSLKLCKFMLLGGVKLSAMVEWVRLVTGWEDYSQEEMMATGERIFNIKRLFNIGCGITSSADTLPLRFLAQKREGPGITVNLPPLGAMLSDYYLLRGWSEEGVPMPAKLTELGLG